MSAVLLVLLIAVVSCQNNKNTQSNNSIEGDKTGTFIDKRDNTEYKWVRIGNQVWMAENLAYNN
ncbi:MAG TPA: FISUMP domain-containing protein [Bacteroidales bacterium]|nr:FISUMP domain-containing protein [Bacteroidales bacterium]